MIILARDKDIEAAQKKVKQYQKEIEDLKLKLETKSGFEKYL